jgi:hypothetical protein
MNNHTLNLTTEEVLLIAYDNEVHLQNAIDNNVSSRILFHRNMQSKILNSLNGPVAQWLEQGTHNALVAGSNPAGSTNL